MEYDTAFFRNGARPSGVLKHPGLLKDPSTLRESWQAVYGGSGNTGKAVLLEEGVDSDGGYLVPEEYDSRLIDVPDEECILRSLGTKLA